MGSMAMAHYVRMKKIRDGQVFMDEAGVEHRLTCPVADGGMYCECKTAEEMEMSESEAKALMRAESRDTNNRWW